MNDMSSVIVPKSDQISADDLIGGPRTITITGVKITPGDQPVTIGFGGDGGRPFKPCKSMCRIMVAMWGPDANAYVGRSMTIFRDPGVKWGGMEVGGIRISHMSHITGPVTMALTLTKGSKKPFTVKPLAVEKPLAAAVAEAQATEAILAPSGALVQVPVGRWLAAVARALAQLEDAEAVRVWRQSMGQHIAAVCERDDAMAMEADRMISERIEALTPAAEPADADDTFPGDR